MPNGIGTGNCSGVVGITFAARDKRLSIPSTNLIGSSNAVSSILSAAASASGFSGISVVISPSDSDCLVLTTPLPHAADELPIL